MGRYGYGRSEKIVLLPAKKENLSKILSSLGRVVIAYSGGLDSAFLLKAGLDTLGKRNVLAVTAYSETYPSSEHKQAKRLAAALMARHVTIKTTELKNSKFKSNPVNRCYYCKKELFSRLKSIQKKFNFNFVIDATNYDDLKDIRHGMKAAKELGVRSPLLEAKFTKADIRKFSKAAGLPTWNKPSQACLASRVPFNNRITEAALRRIGQAEDFMRKLGFSQVRVRLHDNIARIEVPKSDLGLGLKLKDRIAKQLKKFGFIYVTLDLEGYRTGSMHESVALTKK